ncbi:DNAJ protein JJJ1 homolog [Mangifera indica]|uniref:DNAJ protein JJJ1 homolog n=1 Tax=Mangifera indica TaxID=29780 RepID=UPI001CFA46C3|nr:DNAJ protein JJJ1 homolog [Mangifera indica]
MASLKRRLYEVLSLTVNASPEEIRSAYKKLALQRHPGKLLQSGLTHDQATAEFQELNDAYGVLSDQKQRAWYDSHRPRLSAFFGYSDSGNRFYKDSYFVDKIPVLFFNFSSSPAFLAFSGYSDSGNRFYKGSYFVDKIQKYELDFVQYCGGLPLEREELKRAYNDRMRKLAKLVRKKDKRVIDWLRMVNEHRKKIEFWRSRSISVRYVEKNFRGRSVSNG